MEWLLKNENQEHHCNCEPAHEEPARRKAVVHTCEKGEAYRNKEASQNLHGIDNADSKRRILVSHLRILRGTSIHRCNDHRVETAYRRNHKPSSLCSPCSEQGNSY